MIIPMLLIIVGIVSSFAGLYFQYRNQKVYDLSMKLGASVYAKSQAETVRLHALVGSDVFEGELETVQAKIDAMWDAVESVSYSRIFWSFWIPLDKFEEQIMGRLKAITDEKPS